MTMWDILNDPAIVAGTRKNDREIIVNTLRPLLLSEACAFHRAGFTYVHDERKGELRRRYYFKYYL